jgi:hypothetical protein
VTRGESKNRYDSQSLLLLMAAGALQCSLTSGNGRRIMACTQWIRLPRVRASSLACAALALALGCGVLLANEQVAHAQATEEPGGLKDPSPQQRPMMLSFFTGIEYGYYAYYGFPLNVGGRFYIPLVQNGFIPSLNDEFGIEFGLDFNFTFVSNTYSYYHSSTVVGLAFPVEAMYDFHFTRTFDAYVKAGFQFGSDFSDYLHDGFYFGFISAVGLRLKITEGMFFRAEAGYPWIKAGLGFAF